MFDTLSCTTFGEGVMINADTLDVLKEMNDESTPLIISDPPYGAQTHNQQDWDISWSPAFWKDVVTESFRVLKKGGHLVVFASGKTIFDIHANIVEGYKNSFKKEPSFYRMIWKHNSLDSGRVHLHTPRSQFEDVLVYYRTGEGQCMMLEGTMKKTYALDQHVGQTNVLEFYKDDCRSKPQETIKNFFKTNQNNWTFDYKPESLIRALIRDFSGPGQTVVDICMRHGITAVAATFESRKFVCVDIDSKAYKLAVARYTDCFPMPQHSAASSPLTILHETVCETPLTAVSPILLESTFQTVDDDPPRKKLKKDSELPEGNIMLIGTPKNYTLLYVYKKLITVDGDRFLVAFPDNLHELKAMHIGKKDIQEILGPIDQCAMTQLALAKMPRHF